MHRYKILIRLDQNRKNPIHKFAFVSSALFAMCFPLFSLFSFFPLAQAFERELRKDQECLAKEWTTETHEKNSRAPKSKWEQRKMNNQLRNRASMESFLFFFRIWRKRVSSSPRRSTREHCRSCFFVLMSYHDIAYPRLKRMKPFAK